MAADRAEIREDGKGKTMKAYRRISFILAILIVSTACGQQSAPPKPTDSAQSLTAAMAAIQKELNAVGKLNFIVHIYNAEEKGDPPYSEQLSNVVADPATCTIHYHWWRMMHGEVVNDEDVSLKLHDVEIVATMSFDEYLKKLDKEEGPTPDGDRGYYEKFDPPLFMVMVRISDEDGAAFSFTDSKQAGRVGKAMTQAVQLCGGKTGAF
jgi:ferredoxin-NADP reductase